MPFTWPDPISLIADIVTIVAVPTLGVATWNLYKQVKDSRKSRGVTEESVTFYDVTKKTGVNIVLLKRYNSPQGWRSSLPSRRNGSTSKVWDWVV